MTDYLTNFYSYNQMVISHAHFNVNYCAMKADELIGNEVPNEMC